MHIGLIITLPLVLTPLLGISSFADTPRPARPAEDGWSFTVGGGGLMSPDFEGSDDYDYKALPFVRVRYSDWLTISVPDGLKLTAIDEGNFRAGLATGYRFERDSGENVALMGLGDVDGSIDVGIFANYQIEAFRLSIEARQGLSANTGLLVTFGTHFVSQLGPARISIGPQAIWADDEHMQAYFGITSAQAASSLAGYSSYTASTGIKSWGMTATVVMPITDNWSMTALASFSRLVADAADSPITRISGSTDQYAVGLFAGYKF